MLSTIAEHSTTGPVTTTLVDIVIPVYNEELDLERSVRRLAAFLDNGFPYPWRITIADNASTDATWQIAQRLEAELPSIVAHHLDAKGRGRALRQVWLASPGTVLAYMDVDLSTDLRALLPLVAPLVSGHSDVAIGTRLARSSRVVRGPKREFISRCYNLIVKTSLRARFSDAQCGFKAIRADVARELVPLVRNNEWFFDTELLVLAERAGLRIAEVPVDWVDDPGTTVNIVSTATEDLRGIARLLGGFARGSIPLASVRETLHRDGVGSPVRGVSNQLFAQAMRFAVIGVASTVAYFALYLLLRLSLGPQGANLLANVLTALANTTLNRALTFGVRGRDGLLRHHLGGLAALGVALALTSAGLWGLHRVVAQPSKAAEVAVLVLTSAAGTAFRFVVLRTLMRPSRRAAVTAA